MKVPNSSTYRTTWSCDLLDDVSPGGRLELILQRQKPLVHIYTENRVEVVGSLHLRTEADNDDDLLICVKLSQAIKEFIRYLGLFRQQSRH